MQTDTDTPAAEPEMTRADKLDRIKEWEEEASRESAYNYYMRPNDVELARYRAATRIGAFTLPVDPKFKLHSITIPTDDGWVFASDYMTNEQVDTYYAALKAVSR